MCQSRKTNCCTSGTGNHWFLSPCSGQLVLYFYHFEVCDLFSISRIFNIVIRASVDNSNFGIIITEGISLFKIEVSSLSVYLLKWQKQCESSVSKAMIL